MKQKPFVVMQNLYPILFSIFAGIILFLALLPLSSLNPIKINWIGSYDPMMHYLGWSIFQFGPWLMPPGLNPNYGLELSSSIVYSDAIPLVALFVKIFTNHLDYPIQYYGWWYLACMILQAYFGFRLLRLYIDNLIIQSIGAIIFLIAPIFLWRIGEHAALSGQFIILVALYEVLRPQSKISSINWILILSICAGINSYLLVMVLALWIACIGKHITSAQSISAVFKSIFLTISILVVSLWIFGYFALSEGASSGSYGVGKMNILAIFNSAGWSQLLGPIPEKSLSPHNSDLILGRMEGFNYFGAGNLFLIVVAAIAAYFQRNQIRDALDRNKILLICLAGLLILAISNKISIGPINLNYPIPEKIYNLLSIVRASGRLFWPIWYLLILAIIVLIVRFYTKQSSIAILSIAVLIQIYDLVPGFKNIHQRVEIRDNRNINEILNDPIWKIIPQCYKSIEVMPARNQQGQDYWEPIGLFASANKMTTNAVFLARVSPSAVSGANKKYDEYGRFQSYSLETVYVVHPERIIQSLINLNPKHKLITVNGFGLLLPHWDNCNQKFSYETSLKEITHIAAPLELNKKISFTKNGSGASYLVGIGIQDQYDIGWSYPESWGTWLAGGRGLIVLPLPKNKKISKILVTLNAIKNTGHNSSEIQININNKFKTVMKIEGSEIHQYTIDIPQQALDAGYISIEFQPNWRTRPIDIGLGDDARNLSIGIISVELK